MDRARAARRRRVGGRRVTTAGVIPTPAVAYLTPRQGFDRRRRDLGVAQSVRGQRHQGVLGRGREVRRGARAAGRGDHGRRLVAGAGGGGRPLPDARTSSAPYLAHARAALPDVAPLRRCASPSTAPTAPPPPWRRGSSGTSDSTCRRSACEPDGRNINLAVRVHPSRGAARTAVVERRLPAGHRVRRRRRPRHLRGPSRRGRRRRRDHAALRAAPEVATGGCADDAIVATVMSNIGLEIALRESGHRPACAARSATSTSWRR